MKPRSIALCLAFSAIAVAQETVVGGPYVVNASGRTATIGWIVQLGEAKAGVEATKPDISSPVLVSRKVSFTGLPAGKTIHYDVLAGRPEGKGSFKTPPSAEATFEAVVFGDTRTRHDLHRKVIDSIMKYSQAEVAFHTGDLVSDGFNSAQWPVFFEIERDLLRKMAFFPVLGNHERNNYKYYDFFEVQSPYYSVDWGGAHFIVLNTDVGNVAQSSAMKQQFMDEQTRWLEEDLQKSQKATYRVVVMHHPPFSAVTKRQGGGGNAYPRSLMALFERYKVQLVFNGHDHNYQHHEFGGVHYVVTGGGGAPLYPVDGVYEGITRKVVSTEHFVRLIVSPQTAKVEGLALDGTVLDTFEVKP
jgi:3',5'-cyclic AMP phosphodiesterase CpdA